MAVQHDVLCASLSGLDHIDHHGGASLRFEDVLRHAFNSNGLNVLVCDLHALLNETVGEEVIVEVRGEVGHADEILETLDVPVVPPLVNVTICCVFVDC